MNPLEAQSIDSMQFHGKKALTFSLNGLNLGGGLGGKYFVNEQLFIRMTLNGSYQNNKSDHRLIDSTDSNDDASSTEFDVTVSLATRLPMVERFSPYAGLELSEQWYYSKDTYTSLAGVHYHDYHSASISGSLFFGAEYFVTDRLSLAGEQKITISYHNFLYYDGTSFGVRNSTSTLLLSVYL